VFPSRMTNPPELFCQAIACRIGSANSRLAANCSAVSFGKRAPGHRSIIPPRRGRRGDLDPGLLRRAAMMNRREFPLIGSQCLTLGCGSRACVGAHEAVREAERHPTPGTWFSSWLAVFALLTQIVVSGLHSPISAGPTPRLSGSDFLDKVHGVDSTRVRALAT
jgi:hypothetical protein